MRLTTSDLVVLSVLLYDRPMHGHELFKLLEERDVEDWAPVSRAQVYYSLRKLCDGGFLLPVDDKAASLGPERITYKPARKAARAMDKALSQTKWVEQRPPSPFVTWAALALNASGDNVETQITRRAAFLKSEIVREKKTLASFKGYDGRDVAVAKVLVTLVIKQFQAELSLLGELRAALET